MKREGSSAFNGSGLQQRHPPQQALPLQPLARLNNKPESVLTRWNKPNGNLRFWSRCYKRQTPKRVLTRWNKPKRNLPFWSRSYKRQTPTHSHQPHARLLLQPLARLPMLQPHLEL